MTHEIDEVRLTAYALGELDAAEAAEVEALLATNPARPRRGRRDPRVRGIADGRARRGSPLRRPDQEAERTRSPTRRPVPTSRPRAERRGGGAVSVALAVAIRRSRLVPTARAACSLRRARTREVAEFREFEQPHAAHSRRPRSRVATRCQVHRDRSVETRREVRRGLGDRSAKDWAFPAQRMVARVRDFDIETAQGAVDRGSDRRRRGRPGRRGPDSVESYSALQGERLRPRPRRRRALDLRARRRHGLVLERPPAAPPGRAPRQGRGPHRGADQLLRLRLSGAEGREAARGRGRGRARAHGRRAHRLALIGLKAKTIDRRDAGPCQPRLPDRRQRLDGRRRTSCRW